MTEQKPSSEQQPSSSDEPADGVSGAPPSRTPSGSPAQEPWSKPIGRRTVLSVLGLGALGTLFGSHVQAGISSLLDSVHAGGIASVLPSGGQFTIYTITDGYPSAPADYRLRVDGLVQRPLALTVADLQSLPATRLTKDFQCVTGWEVTNVHWVGVRLLDMAKHAGASPEASGFQFTSFDGLYTESLTVQQARETGAIVAYSMLGAPVTREHGGPVRLYVPDMFGYKSIKWLSRIELVAHAEPGYWEQNGYPVNAWISGHAPAQAA
jgi:hypothetical protein